MIKTKMPQKLLYNIQNVIRVIQAQQFLLGILLNYV